MSAFTLGRGGRLLAVLACALGVLAVVVVLFTVSLVAADGHPEGLLAACAGAAVPPVLWGGWRWRQSTRTGDAAGSVVRQAPPRGSYDQQLTEMAELTITLEQTAPLLPPTRTIFV